jgi:hypothetical protein
MDAAGLAKVLSALPTALPYLCLLCKAGLPTMTAAGTSVQPAHTLDLEAWHALRAVCLDRVASGQLRAWMEFALLGGKQPLSSTAAGKLPPPRCLTEVQLAIIKDGLLQLPEIQALTGTAGPQGGSMRRDKPLPEATNRLVALYGRLLVLQALEASSTLPHKVKTCRLCDACVLFHRSVLLFLPSLKLVDCWVAVVSQCGRRTMGIECCLCAGGHVMTVGEGN